MDTPPNRPHPLRFWILWGWDGLITLVILYFFFIGVIDRSVSSFNIALWLAILSVLGAVMGGSLWLRASGQRKLAAVLLWLLAAPGILFCLFFLILLISNPRWN